MSMIEKINKVVQEALEAGEDMSKIRSALKPLWDRLEESEEPVEATFTPEIEKVVLRLSYEQGQIIKSMIRNKYPHTFPAYCAKVGIKTPNFYPVMSGEKSCTLEFLQRVLSGIGLEAVQLNPALLIQDLETGVVVKPADWLELEEESFSTEQEETDQ
ncbi:MAG: hypothetical protein KatS3mg087_1403 [Patescibacteria group bacterium]|nr:MAG: hypothetical protein KatS3mg087_1403 [Patescibacteria group bacterium]